MSEQDEKTDGKIDNMLQTLLHFAKHTSMQHAVELTLAARNALPEEPAAPEPRWGYADEVAFAGNGKPVGTIESLWLDGKRHKVCVRRYSGRTSIHLKSDLKRTAFAKVKAEDPVWYKGQVWKCWEVSRDGSCGLNRIDCRGGDQSAGAMRHELTLIRPEGTP